MTLSDPTLGRLLHVLSVDRDLSNREVAERFGISDDKVAELRRFHNLPRIPVLQPTNARKRAWRKRTGKR